MKISSEPGTRSYISDKPVTVSLCEKHQPCWFPDHNYRLEQPHYYLGCLRCGTKNMDARSSFAPFWLSKSEAGASTADWTVTWDE